MVLSVSVVCVFIAKGNFKLIFYDNTGAELMKATKISQFNQSDNAAYFDIVLTEACEIFAKKYSCTEKAAKKKLLNGEYEIYTNFDLDISNKLKRVCENETLDYNVGAAITNLKGDLVAVASCSKKGVKANYSVTKKSPCSAFKPLAVYAPAIEYHTAFWSTMYNDSPYSKIKDSSGKEIDWPRNANNIYSYKDVTVANAISVSLNTVAVKCLSQFGVNNSINFLEKNFDLDLTYEKNIAKSKGENEVIGNIALGSLNIGCSPVDMAGYYQIFANSGKYCVPKTISKICSKNGEVVFERQKDYKQVISRETAQIVNELLQNVINSPNGTGRKAFCENIVVAGKTGTNDNNKDNWFIGVTPQYSCAIWHSNTEKNYSSEMFSQIFKTVEHEIKLFSTSPNVTERVYCLETGKLASKNCKKFELGTYAYGVQVPICDIHN